MRSFVTLAAVALLAPALGWAGPVNINTADAATLAKELTGIGKSRAEAIVAYRTKNGPFKSADELTLVKGIGQKVIDENRANIRVERPQKAQSAPAKPAPAEH
ncbi:MAG: ComEA family DNA-binding protein [Steroidobacteraceae bacterium]